MTDNIFSLLITRNSDGVNIKVNVDINNEWEELIVIKRLNKELKMFLEGKN